MSKKRNQTATTAAPIRPATMPSRSTDRWAGAMAVAILASPLTGGKVACQPHPEVGVAKVWRQGRAVRDGAPRIGVPPGAAAADPSVAGGRPPRIARGRARVVALVEPVGTPLVAHAREIREPERVPRCLADARRPVERAVGLRIAPGIAGALEAAARCLLPLRLGRQPRPGPPRRRKRLLPREPDDGPPARGGG